MISKLNLGFFFFVKEKRFFYKIFLCIIISSMEMIYINVVLFTIILNYLERILRASSISLLYYIKY
jgi:hypothetical protein